MYALYHQIAIDYLHILWTDFLNYVHPYKNSMRHPRWFSLIISHFLQHLSPELSLYDNSRPPHGFLAHMRISRSFEARYPLRVSNHIERCLSSNSPYYQAYLHYRDNGPSISKKPSKRKSSPPKARKSKKSKKTTPPPPKPTEEPVQTTQPPPSSSVSEPVHTQEPNQVYTPQMEP